MQAHNIEDYTPLILFIVYVLIIFTFPDFKMPAAVYLKSEQNKAAHEII